MKVSTTPEQPLSCSDDLCTKARLPPASQTWPPAPLASSPGLASLAQFVLASPLSTLFGPFLRSKSKIPYRTIKLVDGGGKGPRMEKDSWLAGPPGGWVHSVFKLTSLPLGVGSPSGLRTGSGGYPRGILCIHTFDKICNKSHSSYSLWFRLVAGPITPASSPTSRICRDGKVWEGLAFDEKSPPPPS